MRRADDGMIVEVERGQRALQRSVSGSQSQVEETGTGGGGGGGQHFTNIRCFLFFLSCLDLIVKEGQRSRSKQVNNNNAKTVGINSFIKQDIHLHLY